MLVRGAEMYEAHGCQVKKCKIRSLQEQHLPMVSQGDSREAIGIQRIAKRVGSL